MKKRQTVLILSLLVLGFVASLTVSCDKKSNDSIIPNDTIPQDTTNIVIPAGWSKVGDLKANNMIWSLTSDASGNIYAGGYFTNASGYRYVARWNGTLWQDIGLNANGSIYAVTADVDGNIYATGDFSNGATSGGGNKYVAKWNGSSWSDIGPSHHNLLLTADASGNVYNGPSKWDGAAWTNFSTMYPEMYGSINALATSPSGDVQYAGGSFGHTSGYRYVAQWNGSAWSELGSLNANADIQAIVTDNSGHVYAAGSFTNGSLPTTGHYYVARWDGTTWTELGNLNANESIYSLAVDNNTGFIYASGYFSNSAGKSYVAKWDGTSWTDLGDMALSPTPIYVDGSGKLYSVVAGHTGLNFCVVVHD